VNLCRERRRGRSENTILRNEVFDWKALEPPIRRERRGRLRSTAWSGVSVGTTMTGLDSMELMQIGPNMRGLLQVDSVCEDGEEDTMTNIPL